MSLIEKKLIPDFPLIPDYGVACMRRIYYFKKKKQANNRNKTKAEKVINRSAHAP